MGQSGPAKNSVNVLFENKKLTTHEDTHVLYPREDAQIGWLSLVNNAEKMLLFNTEVLVKTQIALIFVVPIKLSY